MVKLSLVLGFGSVATAAAQSWLGRDNWSWPCIDQESWLAHDEIHGKGAALHHTDGYLLDEGGEQILDEEGDPLPMLGHKTNPSLQDWKMGGDASIANCEWVAGNPAKHCKKHGIYTDAASGEMVEMQAESACPAACKEVKGPGCGTDAPLKGPGFGEFWIKYEAKKDSSGKHTGEYEEDRGCPWVAQNPAGRCGKVGTFNVERENKDGNMEMHDIQVTANFACVGTCAEWKAHPANMRKNVKTDWDSESDRK